MKNNVIVIALVVALLGVVIVEEMRINTLKDDLATVAPVSAPVEVRKRHAASAPASLGRRETAMGERPEVEEEEDENPLEGFGKAMRKMADNPAAKAMFAQANLSTAETMYGKFLDSLDLNEKEREYFVSLLAGELADQQQLGMKIMGAVNAEERKALGEEMEANEEIRKQEIADFLNNKEDQEAFEAYHDRLTEHQQMPGIKAAIDSSGNALQPEQERALVDVMHKVRTTSDSAKKWEGAGAMEMMAQDNVVEIFEEDWAKGQAAYREELQGVLDADQMDAFFESQKQMKEMQLMGIEMMRNMMQSKE